MTRPRNPNAASRLVTVDDAATYVGCNARTIHRRIAAGVLTPHRLGRRVLRIDLDELDAVMRAA